MSLWISTIANVTAQIWETALFMAAVAIPVLPRGTKQRNVQLDSRTLKDIGVEPGSITWAQ
jgi:hypothetical protein